MKRLFVWTPSGDDQWCLCGGPNVDDALTGLMNVIRHDVAEFLSGNTSVLSVELDVREMSDEEVVQMEQGIESSCTSCTEQST